MKKFIVDTGKKKYIVKAKDAEYAVELVKTIDDDASYKDSMTNDIYNRFENETDIDFLTSSLSEMRRYERNWNYGGKKNAGCTLSELRQLIKFAEKRLQELKNKKDSIMNDAGLKDKADRKLLPKEFGYVTVDEDFFGEIKISWYAIGSVKIPKAEQFLRDLQNAINFAKQF